MKSLYRIAKRGIRTAPLREASFHPVLASYMIKDFIYIRQETDKTLRPYTIDQNATVFDAAKQMKNDKERLFLNALIVTDENAKNPDTIVGIISERDIIRKLSSADPKKTPVSAFMSKSPKTLSDHASLDEAIEVLSVNSFRHLPITAAPKEKLFQEELDIDTETTGEQKLEKCVGVLGINDTLKELFRLQVLHKYNKSTQQTLKSLYKNSKYVKNPVAFINSTKTAKDAIEMLKSKDVGSLVVFDEKNSNGKTSRVLSGIFSEHDFTYKCLLNSINPENVHISSLMTSISAPIVCLPDTKTVLESLEILVSKKHRHFPIIGSSESPTESGKVGTSESIDVIEEASGQKVVGMLSARHLIRYVYHI